MSTSTMGVKLDDATRERIRQAASQLDRTPHWLVKQAIFNFLDQLENGNLQPESISLTAASEPEITVEETLRQPFLDFAEQVLPQSVIRAAITSAWRRPEPEAVAMVLEQARVPAALRDKVQQLAGTLANQLRHQKGATGRAGMVQSLLQEFSLSSQEGVALMCLAEALLRIPDKPTRDALIRDKISHGNWQSHLGRSPSLFVNATTWGLLFTGRLVATHNEANLSRALNRIIGKSGEPLIRKGVDMAMRLMGEQFVTGETIAQALANARKLEEKGFRYSYDMLGEAALTQRDAEAYLLSYQQAIHAIGHASNGRGIYEGPGISIKLSALHPRYSRAQYDRVMSELYPVLKSLTLLARQYDIGINIDAEEADRLELSLDLLEKLCFEPELEGWNGIGFVIQAYQKRCPLVIDALIELAQRSRRRLMIRLVKGAYWDSEIKRAQVDGLEGYPVYTRKVYTDVSYLACAQKLLSVPNLIYPQFATHNAHSLAAIYHMAGNNYYPGQYEFQCLHGMGEPLYEQVVGPVADGKLNRPCRIYAPVGTHETLLAYLVRRLLENGANTSFVNRIADPNLPIESLIADPISETERLAHEEGMTGLPHPKIPLPCDLYGAERPNSAGVDLANEHRLASLSTALLNSAIDPFICLPSIEQVTENATPQITVTNPACHADIVGYVQHATDDQVDTAVACAVNSVPIWGATPVKTRASLLRRAAEMMESQHQQLIGILVREAGKSFANAIAEIREAIDFLYYYSQQVEAHFDTPGHRPLGPVVCISPWNFPLAIFTGQIAAALAAGNTVLAKPAEQTPLIASAAVSLLHSAGIPRGVLQLLPGNGESVGARLVGNTQIRGVLFTGSTAVAGLLQHQLAGRLDEQGHPVPLIAETGGINAMVVDSSALTEQVVTDVISSAFDSAGQRCSALRLLCLQDEIADHTLQMLRGAMAECRMAPPERLSTDIGPVIDAEARQQINQHIDNLREQGMTVHQASLPDPDAQALCSQGYFITPTLIELNTVEDLDKEVFGPVLHVVRYSRKSLPGLIDTINSRGYGLTFGVHSRIDETINQVTGRIRAGNLYVNRNMVGAVVGVQPFGGEGLSGTGPKAGGPLYLYRLLASRPVQAVKACLTPFTDGAATKVLREGLQTTLQALADWAEKNSELATLCAHYAAVCQCGLIQHLPGPTGERNNYTLLPKGEILCCADREEDMLTQLAAVLSAGCRVLWSASDVAQTLYDKLPPEVQSKITLTANGLDNQHAIEAVIYHGDADRLATLSRSLAERGGAIISLQGLAHGDTEIVLERLLTERAVSVNTAAAGGNASLMTIS
ncbi:MAG: Bifunctional protein PutA [Candidatus Erwinia impunctatus]|nr:Bifunctional protein PutA [Culicoides impunctatus]